MNIRTLVGATSLVGALSASAAYDVKPSAIVPEWSGAEPCAWTMDYVAATNAAAASGRWTLMQFTGMWWCPHCQALEEGVLTTPAWSNYVESVGVYLVAMDYPYRDGYSNFCWLWDGDYLREKCGGMSFEEGTNTVYRRYAVQDAFSTPGAARQTVSLYDGTGAITNKIDYGRVGYPTLLVLRPGGTVAGRFSVSKAYANLAYVTNRLEQTFLADAWDEPDNFWQTATNLKMPACEDTPVFHGEHTLSVTDTADWYHLELDGEGGSLFSFRCDSVEGKDAAALVLELYDDPTEGPIASETLNPDEGDAFATILPENGEYWLKVRAAKALQGVVYYDFSYSYALAPAEVSFANPWVRVKSSAGYVNLKVDIAGAERESEVVIDWRAADLTATNGVDYVAPGGSLEWPAGSVKRSKTIEIPIVRNTEWKGDRDFLVKLYPRRHCVIPEAVASCEVSIQDAVRRKPGRLSFDAAAARTQTVAREGEAVEFPVYRANGHDGAVTGTVSLVVGRESTVVTNLVWSHGDEDEKIVRYVLAPTPGVMEDTAANLKLAASGGATVGTASAKLLLRDELVEMTFSEYNAFAFGKALSYAGADWFYGREKSGSAECVLRSMPLDGEDTELRLKVKGPAIVEVSVGTNGGAVAELEMDGDSQTKTFPARLAVPQGQHVLCVSGSGSGESFLTADFRIVSLTDYCLVPDYPRKGQTVAADGTLCLKAVPAVEMESPEAGVVVEVYAGKVQRSAELVESAGVCKYGADGFGCPCDATQAENLLRIAEECLGKTMYWRMDVVFEDDYGNVAVSPGTVCQAAVVASGSPAVDLSGAAVPAGWTVSPERAEIEAPALTVGVEAEEGPIKLANLSGGTASVAVKSGRLPGGVRLTVDGDGVWLTGVPNKGGLYEAELQVVETVELGKAKSKRTGCSYLLSVPVRELGDVAASYSGFLLERGAAAGDDAGCGTATLTVGKGGAISGKLLLEGTSVSFSASEWSARTNDTFYLETEARIGGEWLPLSLRLKLADGESEYGDAQVSFDGRQFVLYREWWKTAEGKETLAPYVGTYVAALPRKQGSAGAPQGTGYLSLKVAADGKATYSGVDSLGKAFSGKSTLFYGADCCSVAGHYFGCYLYSATASAGRIASAVYGLVEFSDNGSARILSGRGDYPLRNLNLNPASVYEHVAWTNFQETVGGSIDGDGLNAGDSWKLLGRLEAFEDMGGQDGTSGYCLVSAPSNLVIEATAPARVEFDFNDWQAKSSSYARNTGIWNFRYVLEYARDGWSVKRRTVNAKGVYVPHSSYGVPFWAGFYTLPNGSVQTPFPWRFE